MRMSKENETLWYLRVYATRHGTKLTFSPMIRDKLCHEHVHATSIVRKLISRFVEAVT